jgi:5-methylcytosine-specific restriction endonuclease McrA
MPDTNTLPKPEKRKPLTRVQFATLILAQNGHCGCGCGKKLQADKIIDEHLVALDFLGGNALENRSLWDRDCSKAKTARDLAASAKGKRLRQETGNGRKQPIRSRGFSTTLRRKMDGTTERK